MDWGAWNGLTTNAMHTANKDACTRAWGHVRKKAPWVGRASGKESPRLMHVIVLHCALYLFWGAALVSERGVLVRKENRSGVRKGSCD